MRSMGEWVGVMSKDAIPSGETLSGRPPGTLSSRQDEGDKAHDCILICKYCTAPMLACRYVCAVVRAKGYALSPSCSRKVNDENFCG